MSKKLPGVFRNEQTAFVDNSKRVYYSVTSEKVEIKPKIKGRHDDFSALDVRNKLNYLLNRPRLLLSEELEIITDKEVYDTKLAGKVGENIITMNNIIIPFKDIKDVKIKDRN